MLKFQPKTEDQLSNEMLWPEGDYDYAVNKVIQKKSSKGNDMLELSLTIYNDDGDKRFIYDYLMVSNPQMEFKFKHFCESAGLEKEYKSGEIFENDCERRTGKLKLGRQDGNNGYPPKNVVKDYIPIEVLEKRKAANTSAGPDDLEDEIPFP